MKTKKSSNLTGKKILVIATGSIAAVKTPLLVSSLIKEGAEVRCVISPSASQLISPLSLATLSRNRCYQDKDQWSPSEAKPLHIALAEWAEVVVIAPLSASSLARWVNGLAEGLTASVLLACEKPVIAAAAMNTGMWGNEAIQRNWIALQNYSNVLTLSPSKGLLACDRIGDGRMMNPEIIQLAIENTFIQQKKDHLLRKDWNGYQLLVTAGPTIEDIDSARYLTNRSSGNMGMLLAQAARFRGGNVHLIHGPLAISDSFLEGLETYQIRSAKEMQKMLNELQSEADVIAMTAAISDLRTRGGALTSKVNKDSLIESIKESFELVPDLITELTKKRQKNQIILGFAALTGNDQDIKKGGELKKSKKGCDLLFANPIDKPNQGFESQFNGGWLFGPEGRAISIPVASKLSIANLLLDELLKILKKTPKKNN